MRVDASIGAVELPPDAGPEPVTTDFVDCYVHHYGRLVRALRLGGADAGTAEELAQEAFARALGRWSRISRGLNPPGYVYTTGFRLLQRHLKRASRWDIGDPPEPTAPSPGSGGEEATTRVAVERILAAMPPKRRACAVMCLIAGLAPREAGEALGIADGTVRKHLEEARKDLAPIGI
jgi:RNA polymerase sigma-70 factor (ECF subfamily)